MQRRFSVHVARPIKTLALATTIVLELLDDELGGVSVALEDSGVQEAEAARVPRAQVRPVLDERARERRLTGFQGDLEGRLTALV